MPRRIFLFLFIIAEFFSVHAITYTWSPQSGQSANNSNNWLPQMGGVPGPTDNVLFDGTSTVDCTWDILTVNSFSVLSGYTGNINFGTSTVTFNGLLVINSGSVLSTSGTLQFLGNGNLSQFFILGGTGIFNHNNGNVVLEVSPTLAFIFTGSIVLKTLTVKGANGSGTRNVNCGTNLTVDNFVMAVGNKEHSYQGVVHIKNVLDIGGNLFAADYITVPSNNTANFIFDGNNALILGVNSANKAPMPNIEINTTGTYSLNNNINLVGNWTCSKGTHLVGSSTVNFIGASSVISGTSVAFDNLSIGNSGVVTMPANAEVKIGGDLTMQGVVNFQNTTSLGFNAPGGVNQSIGGSSFTLAGITSYSSNTSRNISSNVQITVLDSVRVGSNVAFAPGGKLTLNSSAALTARVAELGTSASISGNVKVETVIPGGKTGWALLGIRGVNGQTVANWDTYTSSGGSTGIPMACVGCSNGPDAMPSWFESIQGWSESSVYGYDTNIVVGTALNPGIGYWVYVGNGQYNTSDLKLVNTGSLDTGPALIPVTATGTQTGFNLVANPYPSPISWDAVMANSGNTTIVADAIYVWNADLAAYTQYVNGVASHPPSSGINNIIAGGQGFFVKAISSGSLIFNESNKSAGNTSSNPLIRSAASSSVGQVFRLQVEGAYSKDVCTFRIHGNSTEYFDSRYDAEKMFQSPGYSGYPGPYDNYTTISSKDQQGVNYAIQSIPHSTLNTTIPILVKVSSTGTYTITAKDFQDFYSCVGLIDKVTGGYHNLRLSPYSFTIDDSTALPRFELFLCAEGSQQTGLEESKDLNSVSFMKDADRLVVKTVFTKNTRYTISVCNILGQKIMTDVAAEGLVNRTSLPLTPQNQILLITVTSDKGSFTRKVVF
jgi:hypothetical protein